MRWFSMAKLLMFVFNFALFGAGAATLGVGVSISMDTYYMDPLGIHIYEIGAFVLVAAGSVALIMGFLGCCGAKVERTGLLGLYFTLLVIIVVLQVAVGIWAVVNFGSVDEVVDQSFQSFNLSLRANMEFMNDIADEFQCCGKSDGCKEIAEYEDLYCNCNPDRFAEGVCTSELCDGKLIYAQDCTQAVTDFIEENMRIIAGIGIGIGLVEILGLFLSCCMYQTIKNAKE